MAMKILQLVPHMKGMEPYIFTWGLHKASFLSPHRSCMLKISEQMVCQSERLVTLSAAD